MNKFIIEAEFHNFKISDYLREKGYSGRGIRNIEVYGGMKSLFFF